MDIEMAVLTFFLIMILVGVALIFTTESDINSKSGYRLKISTVHTNSAKLKYSTNYGLTWKSVPLGIKGAYEPRFFYSIKLSDSDSVRFITNLFELYLNDYYSLEFYINTEKLELKNSIEVYRAEQLTKLTKSSIT
jgi:hypothetical protein